MTRLPLWALVGPMLLILLYGMLLFFALSSVTGFYEAMNMPFPNHGFMHISWTGKTLAIWATLVVATAVRARGLVLLALLGVVIQQVGDTVAGRVTEVDVFITNIGLGLSALSLVGIYVHSRLARSGP